MALITLTIFEHDGQPFPRTEKSYTSIYDLAKEYGFSLAECEAALRDHTCIRNKYLIDLEPVFLQNVYDDKAFADYGKNHIVDAIIDSLRAAAIEDAINEKTGASREEIRELLGISDECLRQILCRAFSKLTADGSMRKLLNDMMELTKLKKRKGLAEEMQIVRKTKIKITVE